MGPHYSTISKIILGVTCAIAANNVAYGAQHILTLKMAGGKDAQLLGEVLDEEYMAIENPVLQVGKKSYKIAHSRSTNDLSQLICRKLNRKHEYTHVKYVKSPTPNLALATDSNLNLKKAKSKHAVRAFYCVEGS